MPYFDYQNIDKKGDKMSLEIQFAGKNKRDRKWTVISGDYVGKNVDMLNVLPNQTIIAELINKFQDGEQFDTYRLIIVVSDSKGNTLKTSDEFMLKNSAIISMNSQINLLKGLNNGK